MEALPTITNYQPNYLVMCPFCRETASIADNLHKTVATQLILNSKTVQQAMTISLFTEGKLFSYESPNGPRTAAEVYRRIYISGTNANHMLLISFTFKYDTSMHTVCPFGTSATVLLNRAEEADNLLGYIEDSIIDTIMGEASPKRCLKQVLAITRDELTNGTRCQQQMTLYTSSHRIKEPDIGYSRIESCQSHNREGTTWHQYKCREPAQVLAFTDIINQIGEIE